ncbi:MULTISPECIES: queuosine precursor transporter [unclassified Pseudomonas]|uniref:queuosine precursor transporter n=1 Tax=unclassified Pseudomonas TaxID=196821 RepID=UPI0030D91B06
MVYNKEVENGKYKLLGFEKSKNLAVIMVVSTGRVVKVKLADLLKSEIVDDLSKVEVKEVYRKFYSGENTLTVYDVNDRHERSWMTYVVLNLVLFALYVFTNVAAAKLVYIEALDVVVTPGVFLYPLTFLVVDILNESYGLRLARKAIYFAFASNAFILVLLGFTNWLPGLTDWHLEAPYEQVIDHVLSALVASSVSFLFSEYINSYLLSKIKELTSSRYLFLRVLLSTCFAVIIDSFLFCFIAFYGALANDEILKIVYVQIAIKMCFAIFNIFPAYAARSLFKKYVVGAQPA